MTPLAGWNRLEPDALDAPGIETDDQRVELSQAISLKRIADALTGEGPNILTAPINQYGEGIGEAIQGQMERGNR